ncbi:30S ribosomal protein S7 [Candidatus Berkelbacteria bacterium]|nr:30S ribosomal protein S7 [Candidatus Berkelbacteria bacterium]
MRGKKRIKRPQIKPDYRYQSILVAKFINKVMLRGQKQTAEKIVYSALAQVEKELKLPALQIFDQALKNVSPLVEVRAKRIGGATYQVPMEIRSERKVALSMRWIINAARGNKGKTMQVSLAEELKAAFASQGSAIAKRDEMHRMAEANKAFAHYARF